VGFHEGTRLGGRCSSWRCSSAQQTPMPLRGSDTPRSAPPPRPATTLPYERPRRRNVAPASDPSCAQSGMTPPASPSAPRERHKTRRSRCGRGARREARGRAACGAFDHGPIVPCVAQGPESQAASRTEVRVGQPRRPCRRKRESGAADARPRLGSDESRHLRRPVRRRPDRGCGRPRSPAMQSDVAILLPRGP